mgnify:FL=1
MTSSRAEKLGLLEMRKQAAIALSVEIHGLREQINRATDAHQAISDLPLEELTIQMQKWQQKVAEHRQLCDDIRDLAEELNVPMPATDVRRKR